MGMFDGRFKSRGHYDHRMDAGPIIPVKLAWRPNRQFNSKKVVYEHSVNKLLNLLRFKETEDEIEYNFIINFAETTIDYEDYRAWEEGTLSEEKVAEYKCKYLEEYNKSFEAYKAEYLESIENTSETLQPKQTNWQLGGSCFTDRYLDFQGEANEKEVRWGILFSILLGCFSLLLGIILPIGNLIFSGMILIGYSSLLMRHINYKGWNKMSVLALPIVLGILLLVVLSNDLKTDSVQFEDLFYLLLRFMMFENIILIIYLLILSFIGANKTNH